MDTYIALADDAREYPESTVPVDEDLFCKAPSGGMECGSLLIQRHGRDVCPARACHDEAASCEHLPVAV